MQLSQDFCTPAHNLTLLGPFWSTEIRGENFPFTRHHINSLLLSNAVVCIHLSHTNQIHALSHVIHKIPLWSVCFLTVSTSKSSHTFNFSVYV